MASQDFRCDRNRLRSLLEDRLPADQENEIVHHLDRCSKCQEALESLAAEGRWWQELRRLPIFASDSDAGLKGLLSSALNAGPTQAERSTNWGVDIPLDFLDPPTDSSHLGRLASFLITAVLGRGGAGIVLKGVDPALNRIVAIKILAPHLARNGAARKRFDREAQAAAAVVHEHVVAIHAVDVWKGLPYLVMTYVGGPSLQERIDHEGPLEIKEILRIGMQACAGLAAAHAQGLVHRDVKPANILLENGVQRVRLTDFGLARAADDASLTQSGVVAGTPQYMAPEQARGEAIDHRADLFSLGSTLYAMATGQPPFRAESAMAVLRRVSDDHPRPIRSLNPDIPIWLSTLIAKLHAKKPEDRFQSASEVGDLLSQCLAHVQQPDTYPVPDVLEMGPHCGKQRKIIRAVLAIGFLAISACLMGGVLLWRTPLGHMLGLINHRSESSQEESREESQAPRTDLNVDLLQQQLDQVKEKTALLENDLKHSAPSGMSDPADKWILEMRGTIDRLEQELGAAQPKGREQDNH